MLVAELVELVELVLEVEELVLLLEVQDVVLVTDVELVKPGKVLTLQPKAVFT